MSLLDVGDGGFDVVHRRDEDVELLVDSFNRVQQPTLIYGEKAGKPEDFEMYCALDKEPVVVPLDSRATSPIRTEEGAGLFWTWLSLKDS